MLRVSLRFMHVNLIPVVALQSILQKPIVEDDAERIPICYGDLCVLASFRIRSGLGLASFQYSASTLFSLTPNLVHVRLDYTTQYERSWLSSASSPSTRAPLAILDSVISALETVPESLSTLEILCGCPSNPYGQSSEPSPSRLSFPNVQNLNIDTDDEILVLDIVSRCPRLRTLRLSCAYGVLGRLHRVAPNLETLVLNVDSHPALRLSAHLPFFSKKSPLQNWRLLDALNKGLLARDMTELVLEKTKRFDYKDKDLTDLIDACRGHRITIQCSRIDPIRGPCYHAQYLANNGTQDRQKVKRLVAFFVP